MAEHARSSHARHHRFRSGSNASSVIQNMSQSFGESRAPEGFMAATGEIASSFTGGHAQLDGKPSAPDTEKRTVGSQSSGRTDERVASVEEARPSDLGNSPVSSDEATVTMLAEHKDNSQAFAHTEPFPNGYHFPPKYSWQEMTRQGLASFWKFFTTPMGFFWTIYGLNVVAWGAMIFLLLCNAAPAMCHPTCDHIDSPRRKWIEWDAQILTALFCVTGFGLAPWRFRDLYYLLKYRVLGNYDGLRRLAGIYRSWFRLPGSQELAPDVGPGNIPGDVPANCVPIPEKSMPDPPLTGMRAPATKLWKLDLMIWSMVWNTFAQCGLCGIMWGMNRYTRPSWATGFLVAIACVLGMVGGLVIFLEGRAVKSVEGVPLTERDLEKLARDRELGIPHYNNIKDRKPKDKGRNARTDPEK